MHILAATDSLAVPGGSETYLLGVVEQLVRLGHEVTVHATTIGPVSEVASGFGAAVVVEDELPESVDGLLVQDVAMAYALAERWPGLPQVFVAHSPLFDFQLPPLRAVPGSVAVVLNDRMEFLLRGVAADLEVVRLSQPIDPHRMTPRGVPGPRPRRALLLGNYLHGAARDALLSTWGAAGIEVVEAGLLAEPTYDAVATIAEADVVVGKGRAVLEAMSCGRPAFVYDAFGADGWVTAASYARMEADGFAGQSEPGAMDTAALAAALDSYDPDLGRVGRELVLKNHSVRRHTGALLELLAARRVGPEQPVPWGRELARVSRLRWWAEAEAVSLRRQTDLLFARAQEAEGEVERLRGVVAAYEHEEAERQERRRLRRVARGVEGP